MFDAQHKSAIDSGDGADFDEVVGASNIMMLVSFRHLLVVCKVPADTLMRD